MPLYKSRKCNENTQIYIWKITETFEDLLNQVDLEESRLIRLNNMKSRMHQRGFLSVRKLLEVGGYSDHDLYYDAFGKPHLKDGRHISITHSFDFSAIIISDTIVGIDIELQREKIAVIAGKFIAAEFDFLKLENPDDYIRRLTVVWGAKEAIFKIQNQTGISFKDHISVAPFEMNDGQANALLSFMDLNKRFSIFFEEVENFTLVYAFEKN